MTTTAVTQFTREEFLARRWAYRAGQHVTILGPNGMGKTTLGFQLLAHTARPKLPAIVLAMKPRDNTMSDWTKALKFRRTRSWPPVTIPWNANPPGYTLWPRHTFDPDIDDALLRAEFRRAMMQSYKKGNRIVFVDELFGVTDELGLTKEAITLWSRGRSMGAGLWGGTQKPSHVPLWAYNQAQHLFLSYDPDKRSRDRFAEIGGVDPTLVKDVVVQLPKFHWLYIRRDGPVMCVIGP
jgi:energy-coupling factor transporter ATP-binding protein EcfA2